MSNVNTSNKAESAGVIAFLGLVFAALSAWVTHIVVCLAVGSWGFLIAGAIFFPIAVVHGVMIWLGLA